MSLMSRRAWTRFVTITGPFFRSELRRKAVGLLALLVTLLLTVSGLNVVNSFVNRHYMTAISEHEARRFFSLALLYLVVLMLSTVVEVFAHFSEERLGLMWREWLTRHLTGRYLGGRSYHRLNARGDIDNPDQRIAEDVKTFTTTALSLVLILFNSTVQLLAFSGVLWSISPWLLAAAALYAAFGSLMTVLLGRRLVGLDIVQLRKEANLRFELIRTRQHAEPIALLRDEPREAKRLEGRLAEMIAAIKLIIGLNRNLGFFTTGYNYVVQIIPVVIVGPLYIRGEIEFGMVTQAALVFPFVVNAFSLIVKEFQRIATFAAVVTRLGTFWEAIDDQSPPAESAIEIDEDPDRVAYEGLTLETPGEGRLLIDDLTVTVPHGKRLLISGPAGSGKTSLLRATAGLWTAGRGCIVRPPLEDMMFLPQQPYLIQGSLREQLVNAPRQGAVSDEQILAVLADMNLDGLLERVGGLDAERDWPNILPLSERQQLAFARLLIADPPFAFLDEATSALPPAQAEQLYDLLSQTSITYISVSSNPRLLEYHDLVLELGSNGAWMMVPRKHAISA